MSKVKVLSPDIISKIAAGEVVDRPSSVVKELVENAIDAGATSIELVLKDAGKKLIQIKDNGHGIDQDDLEKIFLRHATSKIQTAEDLFDIHSLGFRGEALYSIGAIADVILSSRSETEKADNQSGWSIHIRGGEQIELKPCPFNQHGTEIEINELFFNTPARKKFLKSNTTEIHQILNTFIPYTLIHNACRFKLTHQNKDLIDLAATDNRKGRVAQALNLDEKFLIESDSSAVLDSAYTISMILGDINISRTRRDMQFIFINGRPVQSKGIAFHMNQIFRLVMPDGAFPFYVVFIEMPTEDIDVNIHPTKREVKLKNEQELCSKLRVLAEETLMRKGSLKKFTSYNDTTSQSHSINWSLKKSNSETAHYDTPVDVTPGERLAERAAGDYAYPKSQGYPISSSQPQGSFIPPFDFFPREEGLHNKIENARYIGSFINKYLLFESGESLLVMDQHAAAERITFEQLIKQMQNSSLEIQNLLVPVLIQVTPQELLLWEDDQDALNAMGFETNQWDASTIAVHSHPILIRNVEKAVRYILSGETIDKSDFETLARRACRSSIMAGDRLPPEKAEFLREQLLQCLDPLTCPHGRPTVIEMTHDYLDKQFLRT